MGQIASATNGATRMTTTKQYDYLNRLTQISSRPSASGLLPLAYSYTYNQANQRTQNTFSDGSHWVYQYDALGQVTSGARYWQDGTPVAGEQYQYAFDTIGNRRQTWTGGDTNGLHLRPANYSINLLNQITARDVPGTNDIIGAALVGTNVTVNSVATDRKAEFFHGTAGTNNTSQAAWLGVTVAGGGTSTTGHLYVAQEPEQFLYDADGNLTNDGRWAYTWDAENRLINLTNNTGVGPHYNLAFAYDAQGRRIQKIVTTNGVTFTTNAFLYDGWNLVAELGNNILLRTYTWGNDLSGSAQGAGGVGGLLEVTYHGASATTNAFVAYDGNGNVATLVNAGDGTVLASYEYGPFGETIRSTGPLARNNPIRFSTKYQDDESDLIYYGYRYYKAATGTWPSRDPMEEMGGLNLYANADNDLLNDVDGMGLYELEVSGGGGELLHVDGSLNLKVDNNGCEKNIEVTAKASVGVGIGFKGKVKIGKHSVGLNFDFALPIIQKTQTLKYKKDCCGHLSVDYSDDLIRVGLDHSYTAGVSLGFVAINGAFEINLNGALTWDVHADDHELSTWLGWNAQGSADIKITGGFGSHVDDVLYQSNPPTPDHNGIIAGPYTLSY